MPRIDDNGIKTEYFDCECHNAEHSIRFMYFVDDTDTDSEYNELYLEVQLIKQPFWNRLWRGLKYIFGYTCKYGHWDCFLLKYQDANRLRSLVDKYINSINREGYEQSSRRKIGAYAENTDPDAKKNKYS